MKTIKRFHVGMAAGLTGLAFAGAAQADLLVNPTVRLYAPGGLTDGTNVTPAPFDITQPAPLPTGIYAGDKSAIGDWMLGGDGTPAGHEEILFSGNSIKIQIDAGAQNGALFSSGWLGTAGDAARYEISNLQIAGKLITGLTVSDCDGFAASCSAGGTGLVGGAPAASTFAALLGGDQVNLDLTALDNLFRDRDGLSYGGYNYVDFLITLNTQDVQPPPPPPPPPAVPEPATLPLVALGGLVVLGVRRRRPRTEGSNVS